MNIMKAAFILLSTLLIAPTLVEARPVSYAGGTTVMQLNDGDRNSLHLHYSPTHQYSIGYRVIHDRDGDWTFNGAQLNNLLKRWNFPDAQANFYLRSGVGVATGGVTGNDDTALQGFTGFSADWENRRFFTRYSNNIVAADGVDRDNFSQSARFGVAPYVGNYGDLHTWLMLDIAHTPEDDEQWTVTPTVRFFKNTYLMEAGVSNQGDVLFNWIIRY